MYTPKQIPDYTTTLTLALPSSRKAQLTEFAEYVHLSPGMFARQLLFDALDALALANNEPTIDDMLEAKP
jgi:hypothetical protein